MEADISIWQKPGHFYFALTHEGLHFVNEGTSAARPDRCVSALLYEDAGSVRGAKRKTGDI